jgi:isopropylmalate/homocitrate/citramalate synthase
VYKNAAVCCIAPVSEQDIAIAKELLDSASHPRIHACLDAKRAYALNDNALERQSVLEFDESILRLARRAVAEVEFSPQDATRANRASITDINDAVRRRTRHQPVRHDRHCDTGVHRASDSLNYER